MEYQGFEIWQDKDDGIFHHTGSLCATFSSSEEAKADIDLRLKLEEDFYKQEADLAASQRKYINPVDC